MTEQSLDYQATIHHHENDEMDISISYSSGHDETIIDIAVPDGGGNGGGASRVSVTATELREIVYIANKYEDAMQKMEIKRQGEIEQ